MLPEEISRKLKYSYWNRHYKEWDLNMWEQFFSKECSDASVWQSHNSLDSKLEVFVHNIELNTGIALVSAKKQHMIKTLFCLVHGNPLKVMFSIDVDANDTIMSVREIIEKKIYIPDNMRAKDLTLWKVNVLYNKDAIQVPDNYIHIMVEISNIVTVSQFSLPNDIIRKINFIYDYMVDESEATTISNIIPNIEFSGRILEENIASYNWTSHAKNHLDQRRKVLKYFKDNLKCHPPTEIIIEDVSNNKHLLDIPKLSCLPFSVNSRTDLVLVERNYIKSKMFRTGIHAIIELKKKLEDRDFRQAILEMIVADILTSKDIKIFGILTDMNNWIIYWLDKSKIIISVTLSHHKKVFELIGKFLKKDFKILGMPEGSSVVDGQSQNDRETIAEISAIDESDSVIDQQNDVNTKSMKEVPKVVAEQSVPDKIIDDFILKESVNVSDSVIAQPKQCKPPLIHEVHSQLNLSELRDPGLCNQNGLTLTSQI
ncbi:18779_t:CDS:2 [Funneliformis geosporum]|nr:18779_t:CDS:2 [Funneliformis geosporum]